MHVCVTVSICLCRATPAFIFLICGVTTYGLLDRSRPAPTPEANNLSWNTFRRVMSADSQTHLSCFAVINARDIHPTKRDTFTGEESFGRHYKCSHFIIINTVSNLLLNLICLFAEFEPTSMCDRASRIPCNFYSSWLLY